MTSVYRTQMCLHVQLLPPELIDLMLLAWSERGQSERIELFSVILSVSLIVIRSLLWSVVSGQGALKQLEHFRAYSCLC